MGVELGCDGGIVEVFDVAEGERLIVHAVCGWVPLCDVALQVAECGLVCAQKGHAVACAADEVSKDVGAAVLLPVKTVDALDVEGHPAAVADGEEGAI